MTNESETRETPPQDVGASAETEPLAVPQAATCCDCSHYEPDVGEYAAWCNLHRITLATDYPCDQWQPANTEPEHAASQDGNNAMGIAAVQPVCDDIADELSEAIIAGEFDIMFDEDVRRRIRNVVQTIQRRLTEKDANHAG